MRIVEFCGLPGCGKSTVSSILENGIRSMGIPVVNARNPEMMFPPIGGLAVKLWISAAYRLTNDYEKPLNSLRAYSQTMDFEGADRWIKEMKRQLFVCDWLNSKEGFLLLDEGLIQYVSSIAHDKPLTSLPDDFLHFARRLYSSNNRFVFRFVIDFDEDINRLISRDRANDRFILNDIDEMKSLLGIKDSNIKEACKQFDPANTRIIDCSNPICSEPYQIASTVQKILLEL